MITGSITGAIVVAMDVGAAVSQAQAQAQGALQRTDPWAAMVDPVHYLGWVVQQLIMMFGIGFLAGKTRDSLQGQCTGYAIYSAPSRSHSPRPGACTRAIPIDASPNTPLYHAHRLQIPT